MLLDNQIIEEVLLYLDDWKLADENTELVNESPYMSSAELSKKANKYIQDDEIISFFNFTKAEYQLKTNYTKDDSTFDKSICKITAGRLWNKYNIHVTIEDTESTFIDNYGKKLIIEGEQGLKPFIQQRIRGLHGIQ